MDAKRRRKRKQYIPQREKYYHAIQMFRQNK